jgi:diaminopimelate decarboxylase
MTGFHERGGELYADGVPLRAIAERVGTPVYVYSRASFESRFRALAAAFAPRAAMLCYAVKANSNLGVLRVFAELGAGFDIVSGGELQRVVSAGGDPSHVVFSGVGKTVEEIDFALKLGIACFNVESTAELARIAERAELLRRVVPIAVRVNPDVDAGTHPYISTGLKRNKFGVPVADAYALYREAARNPALAIHGVACHIGSQIASPAPLLEALASLLRLIDDLAAENIAIPHLDLGGGFGVSYRDEPEFDVAAYGRALNTALGERAITLMFEPGRYLVADGGVLLTRVEYLKPGATAEAPSFAIVDAAMNDLIRPALYQAWHRIVPVIAPTADTPERTWQIVGPICESGDFLANDRTLRLAPGDLLAVHSAGAYGMVQASNYNTRARSAEVLVEGDTFRIVRRRETVRDLLRLELAEE